MQSIEKKYCCYTLFMLYQTSVRNTKYENMTKIIYVCCKDLLALQNYFRFHICKIAIIHQSSDQVLYLSICIKCVILIKEKVTYIKIKFTNQFFLLILYRIL